MYQPKNRMTDGGDTWEVDGKLVFGETAEIEGLAVSPVVDNLASDDGTKALSAKQGKALKEEIDAKYTAAIATEEDAGLIKAAAADEGDAVEAKIGDDGKLYVPAYPIAENQADSEATDATELVADFNALLAKLKAAGLMVDDVDTEG